MKETYAYLDSQQRSNNGNWFNGNYKGSGLCRHDFYVALIGQRIRVFAEPPDGRRNYTDKNVEACYWGLCAHYYTCVVAAEVEMIDFGNGDMREFPHLQLIPEDREFFDRQAQRMGAALVNFLMPIDVDFIDVILPGEKVITKCKRKRLLALEE